MLIQYQYIEKNPEILEIQGKLISVDSNNNCINLEINYLL